MADRTDRHWALTISGYALTATCVPLLAIAPAEGAGGLALAAVLILAERTGKALRSPSKSTLLAFASRSIGRGKGFGVHKALDQVGTFSGPLMVAGLAAAANVRVGLAALAAPGAIAIALLLVLRQRLDTGEADHHLTSAPRDDRPAATGAKVRLPAAFHVYGAAAALTTAGLFTFGLLGFHLTHARLVTIALVPVVYAGAMAVGAAAALVAGHAFDQWGARTLLALPLLVASVPALAFSHSLPVALAGIALWGGASGLQDSTVKALVADLAPPRRLATAYGVFAAYQGAGALIGGALGGALYTNHRTALVLGTAAAMLLAYAPLTWALREARRSRHPITI